MKDTDLQSEALHRNLVSLTVNNSCYNPVSYLRMNYCYSEPLWSILNSISKPIDRTSGIHLRPMAATATPARVIWSICWITICRRSNSVHGKATSQRCPKATEAWVGPKIRVRVLRLALRGSGEDVTDKVITDRCIGRRIGCWVVHGVWIGGRIEIGLQRWWVWR